MIFAIAAVDPSRRELEPFGVAIAGRPVARGRQDGLTIEVTRVATRAEAPKGTNSFLYAACRRAAQGLGYVRIGSYILASETGASLSGAGWKPVHEVRGRSWDCPSRPRHDRHPTTDKTLFDGPEMRPLEMAVAD